MLWNLEFLAKQGVMLSFDENVPRTYEMKKRAKPFFHRECSSDVRIRTKHHDMRSQKALVYISGEVILIISSHCSLGWQYDLNLEVLTFLPCLRMVLAVCGHLLPYNRVLYCESIVHFLILTMIVKIAPFFLTLVLHNICMLSVPSFGWENPRCCY